MSTIVSQVDLRETGSRLNYTGTSANPTVSVVYGRPIIRKVKNKKRKKKRYSRSLKPIQKQMDGMSRVTNRVASAVSRGLGKYRSRANKSARKKRDGMLRDVLKNSARGVGTSLRVASKLPRDTVRVVSGKTIRRSIRFASRVFRPFSLFGR